MTRNKRKRLAMQQTDIAYNRDVAAYCYTNNIVHNGKNVIFCDKGKIRIDKRG